MIGLCVLGSTGSIGESTLDLVGRHPSQFRVVALGAHRSVDRLIAQCERFKPEHVAIADAAVAAQLERELRVRQLQARMHVGPEGLCEIATLPEAPFVMAGIVGAAGLASTFAAASAGKRLMLANKEPLVMAGRQLIETARASGATLLPIDSEHNAIFQCLPAGFVAGEAPAGVRRILLTASGGPFLDWTPQQLAKATIEQACRHPNWVMGRKISVDSATLMNKGLELIEASVLFGMPAARIDVIVHRQSVVHSLVEYDDGSVLAQLGSPDMRTPIAHALAWPARITSGVPLLDLLTVRKLEFLPPDPVRFPALRLARAAAEAGGLAPAVLNAANEAAVEAFLGGTLNFIDIPAVIETVMEQYAPTSVGTPQLAAVLQADAEARRVAKGVMQSSIEHRSGAAARAPAGVTQWT